MQELDHHNNNPQHQQQQQEQQLRLDATRGQEPWAVGQLKGQGSCGGGGLSSLRRVGSLLAQLGQSELVPLQWQAIEWVYGLTGGCEVRSCRCR